MCAVVAREHTALKPLHRKKMRNYNVLIIIMLHIEFFSGRDASTQKEVSAPFVSCVLVVLLNGP